MRYLKNGYTAVYGWAKNDFLTRLQVHHRGKENAVKRKDLLAWLRQYWPDLTDRDMRRMREELRAKGVCSGPTGYFIAETKAEVDEAIEYYRKYAMSLLQAKKEIEAAYPEYYGDKQMKLF